MRAYEQLGGIIIVVWQSPTVRKYSSEPNSPDMTEL